MVTKKARRLTKKPRKRKKVDRFPLIETALRKLTKAELVETIMVLAKQRTGVAIARSIRSSRGESCTHVVSASNAGRSR